MPLNYTVHVGKCTCSARDIIYYGRTFIQNCTEVRYQAVKRCLPIVRVDLERCIHADSKALLCCMQGLACGVAACVSNDLQMPSEGIDCVCYKHDVLIPAHQLTLPCTATKQRKQKQHIDLYIRHTNSCYKFWQSAVSQLTCCASHNDPLHPMVDLSLYVRIVSSEIEFAIFSVGSFDSGDQSCLPKDL